MSIGFTEWMLIAVVVVLFFGRGKVSELMGDVAKGIKSFKKGLAEDDGAPPTAAYKPDPVPLSTARDAREP
jgi:sec-independent protein translocase protein TatA